VANTTEQLVLARIGPSPQGAIARLVREFHNRGWRDDGHAAVAMVRMLQDRGGTAALRSVAAAPSREFLAGNGVRRADLEELLRLFL
jgi:hypothetical protein